MVSFTKDASEIFRDYVTDGVPGSGANPPDKGDVRVWGGELEAAAHDPSVGRHTIYVPATAMKSRSTNGAEDYSTELTTNDVMLEGKAFDASTAEAVQFSFVAPKSWDHTSKIRYRLRWTAASGSGGVVWRGRMLAVGDGDALDAAFGTAVDVTDSLQTANDEHRSPESADVTPSGTPAEGDRIIVEIARNAGDGSDTLGVDAILIGAEIYYDTDAENDD